MTLLLMLLLERIGHGFKSSLALPVLNHRHLRGHRLKLGRWGGEHRRQNRVLEVQGLGFKAVVWDEGGSRRGG